MKGKKSKHNSLRSRRRREWLVRREEEREKGREDDNNNNEFQLSRLSHGYWEGWYAEPVSRLVAEG